MPGVLQATYEEPEAKRSPNGWPDKAFTQQKQRRSHGLHQRQRGHLPIAKEGGAYSSVFNVSGIPAAAIVKDGKIIWRGHPARLDKTMLEGLL